MTGKNVRWLLATVVLAGIAGFDFVARLNTWGQVALPRADLQQVPSNLGAWTQETTPLPPGTLPEPPADAAVQVDRVYRDPLGRRVFLELSAFTNWSRTDTPMPHPPEECYSRIGCRIAENKVIEIHVEGLPVAEARVLFLQGPSRHFGVMYWYQIGSLVAADRVKLGDSKWKLKGEKQLPSVIKVMMQTTGSTFEEVESRLKSMAEPLLAWSGRVQ